MAYALGIALLLQFSGVVLVWFSIVAELVRL